MAIISKNSIDKIFDAARIEDVVGDFVNLKKRGSNYVGLSPFVNEKTPSFYVSPAKGIFKCFSSGKGGTAVSFIMEHEKMTYPEALRYLAKKYNIEIEEEQGTPEQQQQASEREQLFNVNTFAQKFFHDNLLNSDEGKSIGLSYIHQRGLSDLIIEKFGLGYSPENRRALSDHGLVNGYTIEQLAKAGLVIENDRGNYDRFTGRVMFPIHNVAGRVVGFGGRTLSSDKKIAKYINSPETDIYNKSRILYGLFQAKKTIIAEDVCYLVEGYMDVISMVQAGVENVVASSGTSLTEEQIVLIKRYTPNITILYDGDKAGIKAAFRGIDLILEKGMNVKVLLFPDGDDPDSFSKKVTPAEFISYIKGNAKDFISFKTSILIEEAANDPVKRAGLIKDIVNSISLIPDGITRAVYLKECSTIMSVEEKILINELNILLRKRLSEDKHKTNEQRQNDLRQMDAEIVPSAENDDSLSSPLSVDESHIEREIARLLVKHGNKIISVESTDEDGYTSEIPVTIAEFVDAALKHDGVEPIHPIYRKVYLLVQNQLELNKIPDEHFFIQHQDYDIQQFAASVGTHKYELANWMGRHEIDTVTEERLLKQAVKGAVYTLRLNIVDRIKNELIEELKNKPSDERSEEIMQTIHGLDALKKEIGLEQGRVIIK